MYIKSDLDAGSLREVSGQEAALFAAARGLGGGYVEVSALTGKGVREGYQNLLTGMSRGGERGMGDCVKRC